MMFPLIYLLLLQAASLTLGAPQQALSLPGRKMPILDAELNGDGEERLREILDRPYSTRHRDGSDSNKPFKDIRFSESEGRARWTRASVVSIEASRSGVEGHILDGVSVQRHGVEDDSEGRMERGADEVARRVYGQSTLEDADAYSSYEGGSEGWKRSMPFAEQTNITTKENIHQHPADLLDALDRSSASPLAWDIPTSQAPPSSLQERGTTDWTCNRIGQKNIKKALAMYDVFNKVFGAQSRVGKTNQCYVAECQD
ncbi:hypothetical protein BDP55DRAFT_763922 [Colletotrichum godetiae]|uniref:Uncharacterized protein n=1 Tax=Colletotrichum godetiae TaxID=1209918 RepID=A0AAJ0B1M5_9PEZI|nr:uncharacterized protein BDP55DRAFT_763922 [Colletotrichum godetiae]KAK1700027.1 hypothetical protein BDP55DRAFT_763922 [Colletotrichum godetiae]